MAMLVSDPGESVFPKSGPRAAKAENGMRIVDHSSAASNGVWQKFHGSRVLEVRAWTQ